MTSNDRFYPQNTTFEKTTLYENDISLENANNSNIFNSINNNNNGNNNNSDPNNNNFNRSLNRNNSDTNINTNLQHFQNGQNLESSIHNSFNPKSSNSQNSSSYNIHQNFHPNGHQNGHQSSTHSANERLMRTNSDQAITQPHFTNSFEKSNYHPLQSKSAQNFEKFEGTTTPKSGISSGSGSISDLKQNRKIPKTENIRGGFTKMSYFGVRKGHLRSFWVEKRHFRSKQVEFGRF